MRDSSPLAPLTLGSRRCAGAARLCVLAGCVLLIVIAAGAFLQQEPATAAPAGPITSAPVDPSQYYDLLTLAPALVAIVLAITMRQVVPALFVGIVVAAFMMQPFKTAPPHAAQDGFLSYAVGSVRLAVEGYILGAYTNPANGPNHVMVVLFTLAIGGLIGVMEAGGGTRAVVQSVARWASNARGGQVTAWFAGLLIFFDDYANCLIIGPTMRPVFDRLRISRQKLSYIIDSTAAPVASVMISTWLATEISQIDVGLAQAARDGPLPSFLQGATGFGVFWASIPYRYYALLTIVLVFLIAITRRDFGPMLKAERACLSAAGAPDDESAQPAPRGRAWYAIVPVAVIVGGMIALLLMTGWKAGGEKYAALVAEGAYPATGSLSGSTRWFIEILGSGDTYVSILYAGLGALVCAVLINLLMGAASIQRTFDGMTTGMAHVFPALVVLSLAWALSSATGPDELRLGDVAAKYVTQSLDPRWLPLATFLSAALVSFATGTSWGTINILCPLATALAAATAATLPDVAEAREIFLATVGAVLSGAVFGDHCSPVSDSTVMAALGSGCSLESHVWTQIPYALLTMITGVLVGDVLVRYYDLSPWIALLGGTAVMLVVMLVIGRRSDRLA